MLMSPQLLHDAKLISCQQAQLFLFFPPPEISSNKPGWMGRINHQIIWLYSPNNLEILLVNAFVPLNICMTQSQYSVIKLSSFIFLPPKVSDSKTRGWGRFPFNIFTTWEQ